MITSVRSQQGGSEVGAYGKLGLRADSKDWSSFLWYPTLHRDDMPSISLAMFSLEQRIRCTLQRKLRLMIMGRYDGQEIRQQLNYLYSAYTLLTSSLDVQENLFLSSRVQQAAPVH